MQGEAIFESIVMCLHFNMQGEDIIEHFNARCCVFTIQYARGKHS